MTNRKPPGAYKTRTAATVLPATKALERAEALDRALRILDLTKTDRDNSEKPRKQIGCSSRSPVPPLMDILFEFPAIEWRFNGQADPKPDNVSNACLGSPVRKLEKQAMVSDMCQIKRANNRAQSSPKKAIKRKKISRKRLVRSRSFQSLSSTDLSRSQPPGSLILRD